MSNPDVVLTDPFHPGERAMQERAGMRERMAGIGPRVIRDYMPEQHREFFALLPFLVVGSLDEEGQPWASLLQGQTGFAHSPHPTRLRLDVLPSSGSALATALRPGAPLGLLGIQPHTRRRNRLNGFVGHVDAQGFDVEVEQSFGNCPQYIHAREALPDAQRVSPAPTQVLQVLDPAALSQISRADTLFIASAHDGAVDVSHRGGPAGFVGLDAAGRLLLPDYRGNYFFNTLGNLLMEPRAGLLFVDFATGDLLQVAVSAEILRAQPQVADGPEAQRLLRFSVRGARRTRRGLPLQWREAATATQR